ncbi:acyltransferase-domain-containing protein [Myxozyma melibiosi]|uniref:Acyltransferase-domain-containing protein n=1 Tax=Myxozyma melibiosi TaxID=54550 RepID=A0ABR1F4K0_9ASCO
MPSKTPDIELAQMAVPGSAAMAPDSGSAAPLATPGATDPSLVATAAMAKRATAISSASTGTLRQKQPVVFQAVRLASIVIYFTTAVLTINLTQLIGLPIRLFSKSWFHAYVDFTKQHFGLLLTTMTQWWAPTPVHVVGDSSVSGLIKRASDGTLETKFGERIVLLANHQIDADWLYLWWIAYTSKAHGGMYIILKESLKNVPFLGWGMQYFKFIFLSRKWEKDEGRMRTALTNIANEPDWPAWVLIFPEGTNITENTKKRSHEYAVKLDLQEPEHMLLPRTRGLYFTLKNLDVPYLYDCTVAYEGVPRNGYGQDFFTLPTIYVQGRPPKSVHMHWRRFHKSTIPLDDESEFGRWLHQRWLEKDAIMESYYTNGHFDGDEQVDSEVRLRRTTEILQLYAVPAAAFLCANVAWKLWGMLR